MSYEYFHHREAMIRSIWHFVLFETIIEILFNLSKMNLFTDSDYH